MDFYGLLKVSQKATSAEIKAAFRKLALELHPDKNGGCKIKSAKYTAVVEAYNTLSNDALRSRYDQLNGKYSSPTFTNRTTDRSATAGFRQTTRDSHRPYNPLDPSIPFNEREWNAWHYPELDPTVAARPSVYQYVDPNRIRNAHAEYYRRQAQRNEESKQNARSRPASRPSESAIKNEFDFQSLSREEYLARKEKQANDSDGSYESRGKDQCCIQ